MIVITEVIPKYSQYGHVTAFKIGIRNDDNSRDASAHVVVGATNTKDDSLLLEKKEGNGTKQSHLPPKGNEDLEIPLDTSVRIEPGQTNYIITISNIPRRTKL